MKIFHNPRCSKSRQTLALIEESTVDVEVIPYLQDGIDEKDLRAVFKFYKGDLLDLVRVKDAKKDGFELPEAREDVLSFLLSNPKYMERPIVLRDEKAILGRPPENVRELL